MIKNKKGFNQDLEKINQFDGQLQFGAKNFNFTTSRAGIGNPSSGYMTNEQKKIILDNKSHFSRKNDQDWITVNHCPICASENQTTIIERMGLVFVQCNECSHVFQNPVVKPAKAIELYKDDQSAYKIYSNTMQKNIDSIKYQYGLELIHDCYGQYPDSILDIGCGSGVFLQEAYKKGIQICRGVDANENYAQIYNNSKGIQFINADFEELKPDLIGNSYECITMWSVLEHIYEPLRFVKSLKKLLTRDGLIFILVPNFKSLATRIIRSQSPCFNWKHPHYFHSDTLDLLFEECGFVNIHTETVITEIENIKTYMNGEFPYHGMSEPDLLFEFITPEYLHTNMLGSRLISIYKAKG